MTRKLQITIPKAVADRFRIRPGDDLQWNAEGESLRVVVGHEALAPVDARERLRLFDEATERQIRRQRSHPSGVSQAAPDRGWTREDLYDRGRAR